MAVGRAGGGRVTRPHSHHGTRVGEAAARAQAASPQGDSARGMPGTSPPLPRRTTRPGVPRGRHAGPGAPPTLAAAARRPSAPGAGRNGGKGGGKGGGEVSL